MPPSEPPATPTFDAGINSSAAWAEHIGRVPSPSIPINEEENTGQAARALYDFTGQPQSSEISVTAGECLYILMEDVMDGWSLAKRANVKENDEAIHMGLLPRTHYAITSELELAPDVSSTISKTPISQTSEPTFPLPPIELQPTGSSLYNLSGLRNGLLRGINLNRFSSFVTSGAEDWVVHGSTEPVTLPTKFNRSRYKNISEDSNSNSDTQVPVSEAELYFIETPPAWLEKTPLFQALVHSPSKRTSALTGAYTLYTVTSLFPPPSSHITVHRRFSHFSFLHAALSRRLPGIAIPPLPEKQYSGRLSDDFVEARRGDLERWLNRVIRHPLSRYAEVLMFFLGCESEAEWKRELPQYLAASPTPGPSFFSHVFHPEFNVDLEEADDIVQRFQRHVRGTTKGVDEIRNVFTRVRECGVEMSGTQRALSYSLLSLITSGTGRDSQRPCQTSDDGGGSEDPPGLMNANGAWCWKRECEDCLRLTKAIQKMAETLQTVADLYDDNARRTQLATHEALKDVAHPSEIYAPIIDIHQSVSSQYRDSMGTNETTALRCETVLNTTLAEFETYHVQKNEDFQKLAVEHLDGEIALYEQILGRLRTARSAFDDPADPQLIPLGTRKPSIYEHIRSPVNMPLVQPSAHVFDSGSAVVRPVTNAVLQSVNTVLGTAVPGSVSAPRPSMVARQSSNVLGRFWSMGV